jgi:indole-3-glycerol phosphate synthase
MSGVGLTGMEPLVEVNNEAEMERALAVGSKAIHPSNTVKLSGRTASNRIQ